MIKRLLLISIFSLLFAGQAGAEHRGTDGTIFDHEYIKYPQKIYEKYCGHHKTAGGFLGCLGGLNRYGVLVISCDEPIYKWAKEGDIRKLTKEGWTKAPLNFDEDIVNKPYAPKIYWFYKCL